MLEEINNPSHDIDWDTIELDDLDDIGYISVSLGLSELQDKELDDFPIDSNASKFVDLLLFILHFKDDDQGERDDDLYPMIIETSLPTLRYDANPDFTTSRENEVLRFTVIFFTVLRSLVYSILNPTLLNLLWQ